MLAVTCLSFDFSLLMSLNGNLFSLSCFLFLFLWLTADGTTTVKIQFDRFFISFSQEHTKSWNYIMNEMKWNE